MDGDPMNYSRMSGKTITKSEKYDTPTIFLGVNLERLEYSASDVEAFVDPWDRSDLATVRRTDFNSEWQALIARLHNGDREEGEEGVGAEAYVLRDRRQVEARAARASGVPTKEERRRELRLRRVGVEPSLGEGRARIPTAEGEVGDGEGRGGVGLATRARYGVGDCIAEECNSESDESVLHRVSSG